jgi:peptide/nickel transport system permease protein
LVWGARISLAVGLVSTMIFVFIGTVIGSIAGYYGGRIDMLISRVIEIFQTFPVFFLILIMVAFVGPSIMNIMIVIGLLSWTGVARLVRGEYIRLRQQDFVVASRALGVSSARTIFRHILPNAMGPVLVAATFGVATGILIESTLSFLGFGIKLPIPSWGSLFIESRSAEHWWIQVYPGVLIFVTVVMYNLFGEGVRDALDPRLKVTH